VNVGPGPESAGRTLYHLHSLGAAGVPAVNPDVDADAPCGHALRVLETWLDHVANLGCTGVLLTPIFVSSTHGYDTVDPFRIDQRLGDDDDLDAFVERAHGLGLAVVLDGVFNHVGRAFPRFRDVLARGAASACADWFRLDFARDDGDGFAYRCFEGHRELVGLNHRSDDVSAWAGDVTAHWMERGVDGWRLDAAYAIPRPFLASLVERVHARRPGSFVFGEMIHGDYAGFAADTGLDGVTQYELHKAVWSSLNDGNFFELAWALQRHRTFEAACTPVTFVGNHDVTRIASKLRDARDLGAALAVLFTVPGLPCVYYGDELAWTGVKEDRPGGDDAVRPPLPSTPAPADEEQARALALHRRLIAFRRDHPWVANADLEVVDVASRRLAFRLRGSEPAAALVVVLDSTGAPAVPPEGWTPLLADDGFAVCARA
jgi:cyclomaltodextrinase / maltogenic alpha-amylase / neopullulanase